MYLKSVEISGFKSFPVRTLLEFGHGMTAIVGPNGCGKSNVSDAIRWVLGEQSAKSLRGSKMEDCIFSGTDSRKALNMAQVSLTLSDCEKTIETEFHEITITRRVFRSSESQYFINKTPCRLKDIQRLFMDTGMGTNSYSLMEQGRIDLILSSRPEDRRAVFEEASGITKYKADKKETLRKLEQTEANLARLSDIIKEVRRQIISLQRQAGKAKRAKTLKQELRNLDIFVSRNRLEAMNAEISRFETQIASNKETTEAFQEAIMKLEQTNESLQDSLIEAEHNISATTQKDAELRSALERSEHMVIAGEQRIKELHGLLQRDSDEAVKAREELEKQRHVFKNARSKIEQANEDLDLTEKKLHEKTRLHAEHEQIQEKTRQSIDKFYSDSVELENRQSKLQKQHYEIEVHDRSTASRRERTAAEQSNLARVLEDYEKRMAEFSLVLEELKTEVLKAECELSQSIKNKDEILKAIQLAEKERSDILFQMSASEAQRDTLQKSFDQREGLPRGTAQLLDARNPHGIKKEHLVGYLYEQLDTSPELRIPLEAALRSLLGAVLVSNMNDGLDIMRCLDANSRDPALLIAINTSCDAICQPDMETLGTPLLDRVSCPENIKPLVHRLLRNTRLIEKIDDLPATIPSHITYVTLKGAVIKGSGVMEIYRPDIASNNPMAQKRHLLELNERITELKTAQTLREDQLLSFAATRNECEKTVENSRKTLTEAQNKLARKEGEYQSISGQADIIRKNHETVTFELQKLMQQGSPVEQRSEILEKIDQIRFETEKIKETIALAKHDLQNMEQERRRLASAETEARILFAQRKQAMEHLHAQHVPLSQRISELESLIADRAKRSAEYQEEIEKQHKIISEAKANTPTIKESIENNSSYLMETRNHCISLQEDQKASSDKLKSNRVSLDKLREQHGAITAKLIEQRMKRESVIERIKTEYRLPADSIAQEPSPQWKDGEPDEETLENQIGELRAKIEAIGPVYEGAIDEYQQLEERLSFLNQQQDDLVKSRQQLMSLIKKIDKTTTQMFDKTFTAINNNFQTVFKQLFGGGFAKLMLADDEDVLESGIEIIARPPGKRLQSISLLSGGERALTAVSLLFAIYLFKPSPFCVLDELDAPLDESNIGRFIKMLEGFLAQSQFVLITHNRQTISAANVLYGITMEEFGVSKVVSMKFMDHKETQKESLKETEDTMAAAPVLS